MKQLTTKIVDYTEWSVHDYLNSQMTTIQQQSCSLTFEKKQIWRHDLEAEKKNTTYQRKICIFDLFL